MKNGHPWTYLLDEYGAGVAMNFEKPSSDAFQDQTVFYKKKALPPTLYWNHEEKRLLSALEKLF